MGLDMYLKLRRKEDKKTVDSELYYWRKANQIRNWLVNHIEGFTYDSNCTEYVVPKETIEQLAKDIRVVLNDHSKADKIIPTSSGFFFGSYEYNEWYFKQLEYTLCRLREILNEVDFETHEVLYDEWW